VPFRGLAWAVLLGVAFAAVVSARGAGSATQIVFAADRRPALDGEIYRVDMDGKRVDLSRSPYADTEQTVSPNGKRIAFLSVRGGSSRIYVAGSDGRGLTPVSAGLPTVRPPQILGWSPDSTRIAVTAGTGRESRIYILQPRRLQHVIARASPADGGIGVGAWSPDSQEFEFDSPFQNQPVVRVVGATGRPAFSVNGDAPAWSARGRLAVVSDEHVRVLSEHGKRLIAFPGRAFAWSPHGDRLASLTGQTLTVRSAGGVGRVIFRKKASGTAQVLFWADAHRVVLVTSLKEQYEGIDVSNGRTWKPSERLVSAHYCGCTSPDGSLVADTTRVGDGFALRVARVDESHARTLIRVPSCTDDGVVVPAVQSVQFATARSVVYQSRCAEPPVDVYSVDPNGGTAHELTHTTAEETEPALSPDGTQVVYVRADARGLSCKGCPATVWIMNADATNQHALTQPQNGQWDYDPSWSPDGTQIVFSRWYIDAGARPEHLFVVGVAGGAVRDLGVVGASPTWGPREIAYVEVGSPVDGGSLWSVAPDGTGQRELAGGDSAYLPAWSRGGELAYIDQGTGRKTVLVVSGGRVMLPFARVDDLAWLEDGSRLVLFAAKVNAGSLGSLVFDVYTVRPDGSGMRRLTTNVSGWPK
jgi:Tol biopolymer transport system component